MPENLWSNQEIIEATSGRYEGDRFSANGVSIDSRTVKPGELFIAIKGETFDGHAYVKQALEKGASAAIISNESAAVAGKTIVVEHTEKALVALAKAARARTKAQIIGITGSVGKTSAKEMAKLAFAAYGETYASSGNYNNHLGMPLSFCNMPLDAQYGIFEMGMNHTGEISYLSKIARPHVALITAVAAVHLEFFDSVDDIAHAKSEIFDGMEKGATAVLNADNHYTPILRHRAELLGLKMLDFGKADFSDLQLLSSSGSAEGTQVQARIKGKVEHFHLGARGDHWPLTALGVAGLVVALGLDPQKALTAFASYGEQPGRGEVVIIPWKGGRLTLIDDAYNASPISMAAAIRKLGMLPCEGRRIAVLGEMLELGPESPRFHQELAPQLEQEGVVQVFTTGKGAAVLQEALPATLRGGHAADIPALMAMLYKALQPGDVVLCKGSHGSKVYEAVTLLRKGEKLPHAV